MRVLELVLADPEQRQRGRLPGCSSERQCQVLAVWLRERLQEYQIEAGHKTGELVRHTWLQGGDLLHCNMHNAASCTSSATCSSTPITLLQLQPFYEITTI